MSDLKLTKFKLETFTVAIFLSINLILIKYLTTDRFSLFFSIVTCMLLCYLVLNNFIIGVLYFCTTMSAFILMSYMGFRGIFSTIFISLAGVLSYLFARAKADEWQLRFERFSNTLQAFGILAIFTALQYGGSIWGTSISRLRSNLLSYDLISHSYITRLIAICDGKIIDCQKLPQTLSSNEYLNTYPDSFHLFFGGIFRGSLISTVDSYLMSWSLLIASSFILLLSFLVSGVSFLQAKGVFRVRTKHQGIRSPLFDPAVLILIGVAIIYPFNLGYMNFSYAIVFVLLSAILAQERFFLISLILLTIACELWSFLYLVTPFLALHFFIESYRARKKTSMVVLLIYSLLTFKFLFTALESDQAKSATLSSTHVIEPILILASSVYILMKTKSSKLNSFYAALRVAIISTSTTLFAMLGYLAIFKGSIGSYYGFKISILLFCLLLLITIQSLRDITFTFKIKKSTILNLLLFIAIFIWLIPGAAMSKVVSVKSMIVSPASTAYSRIYKVDEYAWRAATILNSSKRCKEQTPCVLLEPTYWYQSTHWINNINLSWTSNLQSAMDYVAAEKGTTSKNVKELAKIFETRGIDIVSTFSRIEK